MSAFEQRLASGKSRLRSTPAKEKASRMNVALPLEMTLEIIARTRGERGGQNALVARALYHFLRCDSVPDAERGGPAIKSKRV